MAEGRKYNMEITVRWSSINNASTQFYGFASDVGKYAASIRTIANNLKISNKVKYEVRRSLVAKCDSLNNVQKKLRSMGSALNQSSNQYRNVENQIISNGKAQSILIQDKNENLLFTKGLLQIFEKIVTLNFFDINLINTLWKNVADLGTIGGCGIFGTGFASVINLIKNNTSFAFDGKGLLQSGSKTFTGNILGHDSSATASWDVLGGSFEKNITYTSDYDWKEKTGNLEGEAGFKGEIYAAKGGLEGNIGLFSGSVSGTVGKVETSGKVGFSLFEDGKFSPTLDAEVKAGCTVLEGSANVKYGTDDYNVHADANGKLFTASAEASGSVGVIRNDKGKIEYGAKGTVGAEAYVAEGKVSGGFNLFGIQVDVELKGKAGGAGVKAEGKATTGGVSGEIGLGLGVGGGVKINIDWSHFKLF